MCHPTQKPKNAQASTLEVPLIELQIRDGAIARVQVAWAPLLRKNGRRLPAPQ